jgi:predicted alpha/beta superfamily hydrolase
MRLRTRPGREHSAIVGSSLGGLMAHHALVRHPEVFGFAAILSPAYWAAPSMFDALVPLARGTRVYLYAGNAESPTMAPLARRMRKRLQHHGVTATLHIEPNAKHHESAWRAALAVRTQLLSRNPSACGSLACQAASLWSAPGVAFDSQSRPAT